MAYTIKNKKVLDVLQEVCCCNDCCLHVNYSGRGMFGVECLGFSGSLSDLIGFFSDVKINLREYGVCDQEFVDVLDSHFFKQDNLGKDLIFYMPSVDVAPECIEYYFEEYVG